MPIDHVERAPQNLAGHLRGRSRPRAQGLARAWAAAVDWAEGEAPAAFAGSLDVDAAEGEQLRRLAALVGAPTVGDDAVQRLLVRAQLLAIRSRGTGDDVLGVLGALWPGEESLVEVFPAGLILGAPHGLDPDAAAVAASLLARARSAAVHAQLVYSPAPEAETFRFAPAWASPDPVLDDPGAAQLAQLEAAVGATASAAWFGALEDAVSGQLLVASGGALAGVAAGSPARAVARLCLEYFGVNDQRHVAPAGVGEIQDASDVSVVLVYWLPSLPTALCSVAGKQDLFSAPAAGWNVRLAAGSTDVTLALDTTTGVSANLVLAGALRVGYNVLVLSSDRTADTISVSAGGAPGSMSSAGLSYVNAQSLCLGDGRVNRADPAFRGRLPVAAVFPAALPAQATAGALLDALHGSSATSARGFGDAAQTTGGRLAGVVQL